MQLKTVIFARKDNIGIISFNRPQKLNAQNRQLVEDFLASLKAAEADPEIKVVIVKGEGRAFCSGDDLSEEKRFNSVENAMQIIETLQDTTRAILRMPKPIIAAVHGYALGAGCEWAMNCDIRIAAEGTQFGFPEVRVGGTVTNAGTKFLPLLVGLSRAKEMIFTTDFIDAQTAERWGLVNKVVPLEKLEESAFEMARHIAQHSSLATALSKKALNQGVYQGFEETLQQEARDIALVIQTDESAARTKEALAATKKPKKEK